MPAPDRLGDVADARSALNLERLARQEDDLVAGQRQNGAGG
jgi:hypothetical protein